MSESTTEFTKILVHNGLLSNQAGFRTIILNQMKFLAQSVRAGNLSEQPFIFFLRTLLSQVDMT
jgi:hypothetical protein